LRVPLFDDVGENAEPRRQFEPPRDLFEKLLEAYYAVEVVGGRVEPDDDIAAAIAEAFEDREEDLLVVVAGTVRLNARSEMPGRANGDAGPIERVEQGARDEGQLVAGHDLGNRGD